MDFEVCCQSINQTRTFNYQISSDFTKCPKSKGKPELSSGVCQFHAKTLVGKANSLVTKKNIKKMIQKVRSIGMVGVWSLIQNSSLTIRSSLSLSQVAVSEGKEFYDGDPNCLKTMNKGRHVEICRQETQSLKENLNNLDQQSGTILCVDVPRRNAMRPLGHQGARCQEHLSVDCAQHYSNLVICFKKMSLSSNLSDTF